jgi:hypothetical protein
MRYLEVGRSGREYDRVDWTASRNLCDIDDPEIGGRLMEATAEQSLRIQKPAYHVSVAFDPNDPVDRPRMELVADRVLRDLGLREHQAMFVAHRDREHAHVHIVVNRVHPETGVAWERCQDQPKIERTLRGMEREMGLREVPGRLYRAPGHELAQRALETSGERHARERTHEMSFAEKVREHLPELRQARSWEDLADRLAERGLKIEPKGQGIVITDGGEQQVRASRVARDLSVNRLEQKFEAPFPGKALNEPGREIDPAVRSLVRDIRSYDEVTRHERALDAAELRAGEAAEHAHRLDRAVRDWRQRAEDVSRAIGRVFQAPEEARARLAEFERVHGKEAATRQLHDRPEQFGRLQTVDHPGVLLTRRDDGPARAEARQLGVALDDYRASEQSVRSHVRSSGQLTPDLVDTAQRAAAIARDRAQGTVHELREAGRNLPDRRALQRTIGDLASALSPAESRLVRTFVTDAQAQLMAKFKGIALEIALGRDRSLGC